MQSQRRLIVVSALLHLVLLAAVLHVRRLHVEPARLPGTALGSHISLTYSPGGSHAQTALAARKPAIAKLTRPVKAISAPTQASASNSTPATAHTDASRGGDARGSGNVTVALATFFPRPNPSLPRGTHGDVIVDVVIDEQGRIIQTQLAQSMGQAIDDTVLATIQTWTFQPATKDGVAVPSQQELLFHYERG